MENNLVKEFKNLPFNRIISKHNEEHNPNKFVDYMSIYYFQNKITFNLPDEVITSYRLKMGKMYYDEAMKKDKIICHEKYIKNFLHKFIKNKLNEDKEFLDKMNFNLYPIIKEGTIEINHLTFIEYYYFDFNIDNKKLEVVNFTINKNDIERKPLFNFYAKLDIEEDNGIVTVIDYEDCVSEFNNKNKGNKFLKIKKERKPIYIKEYVDEMSNAILSKSFYFYQDVFILFHYLNYLLEHPEIKEIERKNKKKSSSNIENNKSSSNNNNNNNNNNKINEVIINGIKIKTVNKKIIKKLKSKKIERIADCWGVRGHYRHYKSGKVVYINPYEKGKERNKGKLHNNINNYVIKPN